MARSTKFVHLTEKEKEVIFHWLEEPQQKARIVAEKLGMGKRTLETHLRFVYKTFGVNSREELKKMRNSKLWNRLMK